MSYKRLPCALLAVGLLGVVLYPRALPLLPAFMRGDFLAGLVQGAFLGVELLGVILMLKSCRSVACWWNPGTRQ